MSWQGRRSGTTWNARWNKDDSSSVARFILIIHCQYKWDHFHLCCTRSDLLLRNTLSICKLKLIRMLCFEYENSGMVHCIWKQIIFIALRLAGGACRWFILCLHSNKFWIQEESFLPFICPCCQSNSFFEMPSVWKIL